MISQCAYLSFSTARGQYSPPRYARRGGLTKGFGSIILKVVPPQGAGPHEDEQAAQTYKCA